MRPVWRLSQSRVSTTSKRHLNERQPSICLLCQQSARQYASESGSCRPRKPRESLLDRIRREGGRAPIDRESAPDADPSEYTASQRPQREDASKSPERKARSRRMPISDLPNRIEGADEAQKLSQAPQSLPDAEGSRPSSAVELPTTDEPTMKRPTKKKGPEKVRPFRAPRLETFAPDQDPLRDFFGQVSDKRPDTTTTSATERTEEVDLSSLGTARFPGDWGNVDDAEPVRESGQGREVQRFPGGWETITNVEEEPKSTFARRHTKTGGSADLSKTFLKGLRLVKREEQDKPYGLIVRGVNPNVKTIDFTRLSSAGLESWKRQIKSVQQVRTLSTLDSHAAFKITFHDKDTAITYRDELLRLHRLARFKATYAPTNALWKSSVPLTLKSAPDADPDEDLRNFTILPGSHQQLDIRRDRAVEEDKPTWTWTNQLQKRLQAHGSDEHQPPTVVLDVYPPAQSKQDIMKAIKSNMDPPPDMLPPMYLDPKVDRLDLTSRESRYAAMDLRAPKVNKGRLLMVFTTDLEARRFHRFFNNTVIETAGSQEEFIWRTWMVEW